MKNRGVGALEMLAIEMKASGSYVSRALSVYISTLLLIPSIILVPFRT